MNIPSFRYLAFSLLAIAWLLMAPGLAMAAIYTVDTTVDNGALSACTAAAGDCSLRGAVNAVNAGAGGDTIILPAGTYTLTGAVAEDANASADLDITKTVTIQGAGAVSTIIDGNGATTGDRVIHMIGGVGLTLDGVTITGGNASGALLAGVCGGIFASGSVVNILNSTISNNQSAGNGGGLIAGDLTVTNSTISGNTSGLNYGGYASASLTMTNSTVSGNTAVSWHGAGQSTVTNITNSSVTGNSAVNIGGIYSIGALTISGTTISSNSATGDYGAIYSSGAVTITNSTISDNSASNFGGIYTTTGISVSIDNSTVSGNWANSQFGGIYSNGATTITNSTISGNQAKGAVAAVGGLLSVGSLSMTNSTVSGNTATGSHGGIRAENGGTITHSTIYGNTANASAGLFLWGGTLTLANSIVAGNTGGDCQSAIGAFNSTGNNIDSDGSCNFILLTDRPNTSVPQINLGPLANNGGSTMTHALLPGSLAIDAAIDGSCITPDQRGITRPQGIACDIGAFEAEQFLLTVGTIGTGTVTGGTALNCPGVCSELHVSGSVVSLTATATAPQAFFGWTGGPCDGQVTNPCSVTMNAAQNITANFAADGLIVTVVGSGAV
ncbi:MAG: right-handed parallel beta-helix repeat-containing protein, partial [Nitrospinota bacterium]|nr:right-handed parallel beta-helix repeat-containing protein [Nitrospinota bacterium]